MTRRTLPLARAASIAALLCASSAARADDTADLEGLLDESVVTTASKAAETATTAPATATTITAEDIRRYGIHSIDEAINFLSLGMFATNPLHDAEVGARGVLLSGDWRAHILYLVNGHAMNDRLRGTAYLDRGAGVPIEMVDHIEVILGPGSVLYGSNAMLGVVNVITKRAKDMKGWNVVAESEIGKSWRVGTGVGFDFQLGKLPAALTLQLDYFQQDGPTFHYGPQNVGNDTFFPGTPERFGPNWPTPGVWGGDARRGYYSRVPSGLIELKIGDLEINLLASAYKRGTPYASRYYSPFVDFDDPESYYLDRSLRGDIRYKVTLSPIVILTSRLYGDSTDQTNSTHNSLADGCLYPSAGITCLYTGRAASRWAGLENQASFDWLKDARLVTLLGVDARLTFGGTKADAQDAATLEHLQSSYSVTRHHDALLGAYAQQTWDPTARFGLNVGGRIDAAAKYSAAFSPRVAGRVEAWKNGTLKAIYAEAFRSPSIVETEYTSDVILANPAMRPETVRSVEALVEQRFGAQRLLFGAFRSWWSDMIAVHILTAAEQQQLQQEQSITIRGTGVAQLRNVSSIENFGFNSALEGSFVTTRLRYGLNVTGAVARQQSEGDVKSPITVAPNVYGNARVSYDLSRGWPVIALAANAMSKRLADRALDGHFLPLPYAPLQLELRATVSGDVPGMKGLSYRASVDWALADRAPYVVGPNQSYPDYRMAPELAPVDTLRATIGLTYRLGE
jgi:outer membrane receptor for ferrienterochelin and colicins